VAIIIIIKVIYSAPTTTVKATGALQCHTIKMLKC